MEDNDAWATIPVEANFGPCNEIRIVNSAAVHQIGRRIKHWSAQATYPKRERLAPIIDRLQHSRDELLSELNIDLIHLILGAIDHTATEIVVDTTLRNADDIPDAIAAHGNVYLSGSSGLKYLRREVLGNIHNIYFQKIAPHIGPETVLHLIAREDDPKAELAKVAKWQLWPSGASLARESPHPQKVQK
jgi:hypothetical protein